MNAIKGSIKSARTVVGTAGAPNVDVSILADAGYDFLLFDTQHSPWEIKQLRPMDLAIELEAVSVGRRQRGCRR
jgi:2-keto-3-deoxy-L-rhamnonate aldolase RhmA